MSRWAEGTGRIGILIGQNTHGAIGLEAACGARDEQLSCVSLRELSLGHSQTTFQGSEGERQRTITGSSVVASYTLLRGMEAVGEAELYSAAGE